MVPWSYIFHLLHLPILKHTNYIVPSVCGHDWVWKCNFTIWIDDDANKPKSDDTPSEELELLEDAQHVPGFPDNCKEPRGIECRTVDTHEFSNETADAATCDMNSGLRCVNHPNSPLCRDYEVRYYCCVKICPTTVPPVQTTTVETTTKGN